MTVQNVMKVIDIFKGEVSKTTRDYLHGEFLVYKDLNDAMNEDLINIIIEDEELKEVLPSIRNEVQQLRKLAEENDAAYVRFTTC